MEDFRGFLNELGDNSNIQFRITSEDGAIIFTSSCFQGNSDLMYIPIHLDKTKVIINIDKKYELCSNLLKYTIESKFKEMHSVREQVLIDIIEGKEITEDKIVNNLPFIKKGSNLLLVNCDKSMYEALNIIKQIYSDEDVISIIYGDSIVIIGSFEEVQEHAKGISEAVTSNLFCKCFVGFSGTSFDKFEIRKAYNECKECMVLGRKYNIKEDVLNYNKLLFEKVVYSINSELKEELLVRFRERFNAFDSEMITTIEEFVNCGLNISDTARRIYIHRNTLIYRLDKIKKETGFDIRNFKEATVFIIAFLVWKELN